MDTMNSMLDDPLGLSSDAQIQIAPIGDVKEEPVVVQKRKRGRPKGKKDSIKRKGIDYVKSEIIREVDAMLAKYSVEIKEFVSTPAMKQIATDHKETGTNYKIPKVEQLLNSRSESEMFREATEDVLAHHYSTNLRSGGLRFA